MEVESQTNKETQPKPKLSKNLKLAAVIINIILMALGNTGGPLVSRLYFDHGGTRQWLSSFLETAGFPVVLLPLYLSFLHRRRVDPAAKAILTDWRIFAASAAIGLSTGLDDFLYAYGLSFLPVSTSALLTATQLGFTALFAFLIVRQRFTAFSINSVALLSVGAALLGLHTGADRPKGVSKRDYYFGFVLTLGAAALYGLILPLIELMYKKARQEITYTLVMEMQLIMGFFATAFCTVGMIVNKDFQAISREAKNYGLGETKYYLVIVWSALFWQCFFLGTVGVIFCVNTLMAGILIAVFIPMVEVLGVIFIHEKFSSEKGVALVLSLWGLASYSYGEYLENKTKKKKMEDVVLSNQSTNT